MADVPPLQGNILTDQDPVSGLTNRQDKLETLMQYVVLVLLLMTAGLVVSVGGIVIDLFRNEAVEDHALKEQMRALEKCLAGESDCRP